MSKYKEWQSTKTQLECAKLWVSNRDKIDSQDGKSYTKVGLQKVKLEYCGQSSAGANNYHEAPHEFQRYIAQAINEMRETIEDLALSMLDTENNKRAIDAKSDVAKMLDEIELAEGCN